MNNKATVNGLINKSALLGKASGRLSLSLGSRCELLFMKVLGAAALVLFGASAAHAGFLPAIPNGTATCGSGVNTVIKTLGAGQTLSIVNGGDFLDRTAPNNLIVNGSFELPANGYFNISQGGNTGVMKTNLTGWTSSGGGTNTYASDLTPASTPYTINLEGSRALYFGAINVTCNYCVAAAGEWCLGCARFSGSHAKGGLWYSYHASCNRSKYRNCGWSKI